MSIRLEETGGVIGRAQDSDLCLPDPERFVSRRQAEIHYRDGDYFVSDIGSGNPVCLNGTPIPRGRAAQLQDGDALEIGEYDLLASISVGSATTPPRFTYTRLDAPEAAPQSVLAESLQSSTQVAWSAAHAPFLAPDLFGEASLTMSNGDDVALFGDEQPKPMFRGSEGDRLPEIFGPMLSISMVPDDYDFLHDAPRVPEANGLEAAPNHTGTSVATDAVTDQSGTGREALGGADFMDAKLKAADEILRGAKLNGAEFDRATKLGIAYRSGELLRECMRGLMAVLLARSRVKAEFGLKRRPVGTRENNPLKVFPSVDECLLAMLNSRSRGFLPAVTAVREACDDVQAHELALMAGSRAALLAVMRRFDPQTIEVQVKPTGLLDRLLPSRRRARAWSQFCERYKKLGSEVDDDFQALIGEEFVASYQDQVERLQSHAS